MLSMMRQIATANTLEDVRNSKILLRLTEAGEVDLFCIVTVKESALFSCLLRLGHSITEPVPG